MRNLLAAGTAGLFLVFGAAGGVAHAQNPNVPSWSPYSIVGYDAAPRTVMTERRAADTTFNEPANAPVDYKSVGLSSHREDCNSGCAAGSTE
jgi:hypothetical protein